MDKESSFDIIRRHCYEDKTIVLNDEQKVMLSRWDLVIELRTCEKLKTKDIIQKLIEKFEVKRATAFNDIAHAEELFGWNITINKRSKIAQRIVFLEEYIEELKEAKEHVAAAMQEKNLTKWYELYPELKTRAESRVLRFSYSSNKPLSEELPAVEDAEFTLLEAAKNG